MKDFVTVKTEGMTTVFIEPTQSELSTMGYRDMYHFEEDFKSMVEGNYPGLLRFAEFDTNSRFMAINCDTEEIADTIKDELKCLLEYFSLRKKEDEEIQEQIRKIEIELVKLKNLLT